MTHSFLSSKIKMFWKIPLPFLVAVLLLAGCGNTRQALMSGNMTNNIRNPSELRVAILPFERPGQKKDENAEYIRKQVFINMKRGGYNLVERFVVDGILEYNDWSFAHLEKMAPQRLGEALGADAIIYGKVTHWSKSYLAIHSSITIGSEVKMVDTRSGEVLWKSNYKKTDFDGIFKIPTGISSAALAPILFLTNKKYQYRLADEVAYEMTAYLVTPKKSTRPSRFKDREMMASSAEALAEIKEWSPDESRFASLFDEEFEGEKVDPMDFIESDILENGEMVAQVEENENDVLEPTVEKEKEEPVPLASIEVLAGTEHKDQTQKIPGKTYTIQVGSYIQKESAEHFAGSLRKDGIDAFISEARLKDRTWYRVQVNTFRSVAEAEQFASKSIEGRKIRYFITPLSVG